MRIQEPEDWVGATVGGRYRLDHLIGRGGSAAVFEATHTWTSRRVAVKLLLPGVSTSANALERFLREAKTTGELHHPHVVEVLDMGVDEGAAFLVLERLRGESLAQRMARAPLRPEEVVAVTVPLLRALSALHAAGVVHRDVKPDNVFLHLDIEGRVVPKLLDFGISKRLDAPMDSLTAEDGLLGTPHYMSPEQVDGPARVQPASDLWSVGVVMFECLSGRRPYADGPLARVLTAIASRPPHALADLATGAPPALVEAVERALRREPSERHADADAFAEHLEAIARDEGWSLEALPDVEPPPEATPRRRPAASAEAATVTRPGAAPNETPVAAPVPSPASRGSTSDTQPARAPTGRRRLAGGVALAAVGLGLGAWALFAGPPAEAGSDGAESAANTEPAVTGSRAAQGPPADSMPDAAVAALSADPPAAEPSVTDRPSADPASAPPRARRRSSPGRPPAEPEPAVRTVEEGANHAPIIVD